MLSLIQYEAVDRFQWLSTKELLDGIALGQITPGPVLITATFVGYKVLGFLGAVLATVGVFAPCFFILVLLLPYHNRMGEMEKVRRMEKGILGAFLGMLGGLLYHFGRASLVDAPTILLAGAAFVALYKNVKLPYVLIAGGRNVDEYVATHPGSSRAVLGLSACFGAIRSRACKLVDGTVYSNAALGAGLGLGIPLVLLGVFRLAVWLVGRRRKPAAVSR